MVVFFILHYSRVAKLSRVFREDCLRHHHIYPHIVMRISLFSFTSFKYNTKYDEIFVSFYFRYFRGFAYFISLCLEKYEIKDVCLQRRQQTRAGTETKSQAKKTWACQIGNA